MIINNEECRPVTGAPRAVVSETGRVYRTLPITQTELHTILNDPEHKYFVEYKPQYNVKAKCYTVAIRTYTVMKIFSIPSIVAKAWNKYPNGKREYFKLIYKDENPNNTHYSNLKYERKTNDYILSKEDMLQAKKMIDNGIALRQIAKLFHVNEMHIQRIKNGEKFGERTTAIPEIPINVDSRGIKRSLTFYRFEKTTHKNEPFTIIRNPNDGTDNIILGTVNQYRIYNSIGSITRARRIAQRFNEYFNLT